MSQLINNPGIKPDNNCLIANKGDNITIMKILHNKFIKGLLQFSPLVIAPSIAQGFFMIVMCKEHTFHADVYSIGGMYFIEIFNNPLNTTNDGKLHPFENSHKKITMLICATWDPESLKDEILDRKIRLCATFIQSINPDITDTSEDSEQEVTSETETHSELRELFIAVFGSMNYPAPKIRGINNYTSGFAILFKEYQRNRLDASKSMIKCIIKDDEATIWLIRGCHKTYITCSVSSLNAESIKEIRGKFYL